jgi:hypothetical protein
MNLQAKTLNRYRQFFPNETLKETSERTGIQITRVFRLFNGKNMKVAELEALERIIQNKISENPQFHRLSQVLEEASAVLTNDELEKLVDHVSRRVKARTFGRFYIKSYQNAIIA